MTRRKMVDQLHPIHPGEILLEEFLKPLKISQYRLAKDINVPARRINEIVHGIRAVSPDTALRLSKYFGLSERYWLNIQTRYDLDVEKSRLKDRLDQEVRVFLFPENVQQGLMAKESKSDIY
ncbi:MAG TPA: addiction module antidote protein, HigA family [Anaerolineaceae bacterium]|nr:addiction module antidote protein, HigA family [Anaerolineaceae bacterium]